MRLLFESKGVVMHIGNENTAGNYLSYHPAGKNALFVVYEAQYLDAESLLNDPNHVVKNPLDVAEYRSLLSQNSNHDFAKIVKVLWVAVGVIVIATGLVWYAYE